MRFACLLALLATVAGISAAPIDTIRFEPDRLVFDRATGIIRYPGGDLIAEAGRPVLPLQSYYYYSFYINESRPISGRVLAADTIAPAFPWSLNPPDQTTSDGGPMITPAPIVPGPDGLYPAVPCLAAVQQRAGCLIWSVAVFPVQFLADGRLIVNREIELAIDDPAPMMTAGMPPDENLFFAPIMKRSSSSSSGEIPGCPLGGDWVIIASPDLAEAWSSLVYLKRLTGFDADMAVTDSIYSAYGGRDQAEALRNYLKDFYQAGGRYVVLGGDETQVPVRYAYYCNTDTIPSLNNQMICDLYFADCTGDWDVDGDGIWGEPTDDRPDIGPELAVGRLPFSRPEQVAAFTDKLRSYLFQPGAGDRGYLTRTAFFCSDQMRDYFTGGQQYNVAAAFPDGFATECERVAETPTGDAPSPVGPSADDALAALSEGYGLINVLAHGRPDGFILNSSGYNQYPKTYIFTGQGDGANAGFGRLPRNEKTGFYYSIACEQGAFDGDILYGLTVPSVVEDLLGLDSAGAIGMVAFSRWGWIATSYKLMASFYRHLFSDAAGYPAAAMARSWLDYPYYRDQIYGQLFLGDPSLRLYLTSPAEVTLAVPDYYSPNHPIALRVTSGDSALTGQAVTVTLDDSIGETVYTDGDGNAQVYPPAGDTAAIQLTVYSPGAIAAARTVYPSLTADVDDDDSPLPAALALDQNAPNPFNPSTTIGFSLTHGAPVNLVIYDVLGRLVTTLVDRPLAAGRHQVQWNGTDDDGQPVASGVYLYRLRSTAGTAVRKMILIR